MASRTGPGSPRVRLVALATTALLAACGGPTTVATVPADIGPPADEPTVTVVDTRFEPREIVVASGAEVTWVWDARIVHDVTGDGFKSATQNSGTFTHAFTSPGTYEFLCSLHPGMSGTVYVVES
jgi:plastocyanin